MDKPQRYGRCIPGSSPGRTTKIRTYVVVVANDLAMVEAPDRTRIGALTSPRWCNWLAQQIVILLVRIRVPAMGYLSFA